MIIVRRVMIVTSRVIIYDLYVEEVFFALCEDLVAV